MKKSNPQHKAIEKSLSKSFSIHSVSDVELSDYKPPQTFTINKPKSFRHTDGSMHLEWKHRPSKALVVEKINSPESRQYLIEVVQYLHFEKKIVPYIEPYVAKELTGFKFTETFEDVNNTPIDFVLVFGGDGTLLHVASLFPEYAPPIVPFAIDQQGFLTPFCAVDYKNCLELLLRGSFYVTLRTRLYCDIIRNGKKEEVYQALNDIVIAPSETGKVCALNCYIDDELFSTLYGDGLIISTSTGSTAYNLSAGGAVVNPSIAAILWTPICSHALSAHPIILPDCVYIDICIDPASRTEKPYNVAVDSKRAQILKGDFIGIHQSPFPIPTVCASEPMNYWLQSLTNILEYNEPMDVEE